MTGQLVKPLGHKSYGSIPHLPGSRMGPGDHHCHEGQARICTVKLRDSRDRVFVTEKLDGSCCAVAKVDGRLIALGRAGWPAASSNYEQHRLFDQWVYANYERFDRLLSNGERVVGEWLAQAHGTRYDLTDRSPFVPFDLFDATNTRIPYSEFDNRVGMERLYPAPYLWTGPASIGQALHAISYRPFAEPHTYGQYGALEPVEGAVWRVERDGKFQFMAKWVRPDKVDGKYFEDKGEPVWNWRPTP